MKATKFVTSALASAAVIGAIGIAYAQTNKPDTYQTGSGPTVNNANPSDSSSSAAQGMKSNDSSLQSGDSSALQSDSATERDVRADRG